MFKNLSFKKSSKNVRVLISFFIILIIFYSITIFAKTSFVDLKIFSKYSDKKKQQIIESIIKNNPETENLYKYILLLDSPKDYFVKLKDVLKKKISDDKTDKTLLIKYQKNLIYTYLFLYDNENFSFYFEKTSKYFTKSEYNFLYSVYLLFTSIEGTELFIKGATQFAKEIQKIEGFTKYILKYPYSNELLNIVVNSYEKQIINYYKNDKKSFNKFKKTDQKIFESLLYKINRPDTLSSLIKILTIFDSEYLKQNLNNFLTSGFNDVKLASINALFKLYDLKEIDFSIFDGYLKNSDIQFKEDVYKIISKISNDKVINIYKKFYNNEPEFLKQKIIEYLALQNSVNVVTTYLYFFENEKSDNLKKLIKNNLIKFLDKNKGYDFQVVFLKQINNNKIFDPAFLLKTRDYLFSPYDNLKKYSLEYFYYYYDSKSLNEHIIKFIFNDNNLSLVSQAFKLFIKWDQSKYITKVFKNISRNINESVKNKKSNKNYKQIIEKNLDILKIVLQIKGFKSNVDILNYIYSIKDFIKAQKSFEIKVLYNYLETNKNTNNFYIAQEIILLSDYFNFFTILNYYLTSNDLIVSFDLNIIRKNLQKLYVDNLINLFSRKQKISFTAVDIITEYFLNSKYKEYFEKSELFNRIIKIYKSISINYLKSLQYFSKKVDISLYLKRFEPILQEHYNDEYYNIIKEIYTYYIGKKEYKKKNEIIDFLYRFRYNALPIYYSFIDVLDKSNDISNLSLVIVYIGQIGNPESISVLKNLLSNKSLTVQIKTIEALSKIRSFKILDVLINWGENHTNNVSAQIYIFKVFEKYWVDRCFNYLQIFVNGKNKILKEKALFLLSLHPKLETLNYFLKDVDLYEEKKFLFYQFYNQSQIDLRKIILNKLKEHTDSFFKILLDGIIYKKLSYKDKILILFLKPYVDENKNYLVELYFNISDKKPLLPFLALSKDDQAFSYAVDSVNINYSCAELLIWGFLNQDPVKVYKTAKLIIKYLNYVNKNDIDYFLGILIQENKTSNLNNIIISDNNIYKLFNKNTIFKLLESKDYKLAANSLILLNKYKLNLEDLKKLIKLNPNYVFLFKNNIEITKYESFIFLKFLLKEYTKFDSEKKLFILKRYLTYLDNDLFNILVNLYVKEQDSRVFKYIEEIILKNLSSFPERINSFFYKYITKNRINKFNKNNLYLNFLIKVDCIESAKIVLREKANISSNTIITLLNSGKVSNSLLYYLYKRDYKAFIWVLESGIFKNFKISNEFLNEIIHNFKNDPDLIKYILNSFDINGNEIYIKNVIININSELIKFIYLEYLVQNLSKNRVFKSKEFVFNDNNNSSKNNNIKNNDNKSNTKNDTKDDIKYNNKNNQYIKDILNTIVDLYINIKSPVIKFQAVEKISTKNKVFEYFIKSIFINKFIINKTTKNNINHYNSNKSYNINFYNTIYPVFKLSNINFDVIVNNKDDFYKSVEELLNIIFTNNNIGKINFDLYDTNYENIFNNNCNFSVLKKYMDLSFKQQDYYKQISGKLSIIRKDLEYIFDNININSFFKYLNESKIKNRDIIKYLLLVNPDYSKYFENKYLENNNKNKRIFSLFNKKELKYLIWTRNPYIIANLALKSSCSLDKLISLYDDYFNRVKLIKILGKDIIFVNSSYKILKNYIYVNKNNESYFYTSMIMNFERFSTDDKILSSYLILKNYKKLNYYFLRERKQFESFVIFLFENMKFYNPKIVSLMLDRAEFPFYRYSKLIFNKNSKNIYYENYFYNLWDRLNILYKNGNFDLKMYSEGEVRLFYLKYFLKKYKNADIIGNYLLPYLKDNYWLSLKMFDIIIKDKIKGLLPYLLKYYNGKKWKNFIYKYKKI